ncbi:MAG: apolipoprotein N-acyltransferase [Azoarcus sp.]|jgi:apolipoprotein N-acyltransferase|nr:apolipoprotein N-acyltransferase [Azoarcus sp.]
MRNVLWALAAGAGGVLAFAPFDLFVFGFASIGVLAWRVERAAGSGAAFVLGLLWGLACFGVGVSWLFVALERYGGMPAPLAALAVLLFCAYLALYPALAMLAYFRLRRGGAFCRAGIFAALWFMAEWLRGVVFTGFPWLAIGYSQTPPSPLAGWLPMAGVYGVGALVAALAAWGGVMDWRVAHNRRQLAAALLVVGGGGWLAGRLAWVEPVGEPLAVSLVQTNFEQALKWSPEHFHTILRTSLELVRASRGQLVVLPETALPALVEQLPGAYVDELGAMLDQRGATLVTGVFARDADRRIYNAASTFGVGAGQYYAKRHLVPFGEYSPPLFGWFYRWVHIPMSNQSRGVDNPPPLELFGRKIAVNICYEDVFGAELVSRLPEAGLMLNLSNLAWYGDSFAQPQHLQIARVRAIESGRPMLRATNTGMTALILPDGAVAAVLPAFTRDVLEVSVSAWQGMTPYARWGDVPALLIASLSLFMLFTLRRQSRSV